MPGVQQGHYAKGELRYEIEHANITLAELQDVSYDFAPSIEAGGAGIGLLKNSYFKTTDAPKGSGKLARHMLQRTDYGKLFLDILSGTRVIYQEPITAASTTYTPTYATSMISILEIRNNVSSNVLREAVDYNVNWVTGAITFTAATAEAATIRYISNTRKGQQFLINGGFEDALGSTWSAFGTATIARNTVTANVFAEGAALAVTPAVANDGVQYNVPVVLVPGRTYRFQFRAKAAAAETLAAYYYNGTTDVVMAPATVTLATTYAIYEYTFVATVAAVANLKIKDTKASPAIFYLDEVKLIDDSVNLGSNPTFGTNPMDAGFGTPITFNIIERRIMDGVITARLMKCAPTKVAVKSGKMFAEDIEFQFLDYLGE